MTQIVEQYFFRPGWFGAQILWVKVSGTRRDLDCGRGGGRDEPFTCERKATPSEASAILPVLNAGLPPNAPDNRGA